MCCLSLCALSHWGGGPICKLHLLCVQVSRVQISHRSYQWLRNWYYSSNPARHLALGKVSARTGWPGVYTATRWDSKVDSHFCFRTGLLSVSAACQVQFRSSCALTVSHTGTVRKKVQTRYLVQSEYTNTRPTSPSSDPIMPGLLQGSHKSVHFSVTGTALLCFELQPPTRVLTTRPSDSKMFATMEPCCNENFGVKLSAFNPQSASGAEDPWFESHLRWDFSGSSHTSDFKISTPVATLPGAWRYRGSAGTGWPGDGILWLGEVESLICNFYLSVAAHKRVWADPSLRYTHILLGY